jgi:hypothetical protein
MRHRQWLAAIGASYALSGFALAQQPNLGQSPLGGGQVVSSGVNLSPGGTRLPAAAPQAGTNIGSPLTRPYDPTNPLGVFKGTGINPKDVIAPVAGLPGTQQPDLLERVSAKLGSVTSFFHPAPPQAKTITPGIFRRNRERAHQMNWRRD